MATANLPGRPNLEQLRQQARELQRAVRAGAPHIVNAARGGKPDAGYQLTTAQLDVARYYGFPSWDRLRRHVEAISARSWIYAEPGPAESSADQFLRLACLNYTHDTDTVERVTQATELLRQQPGVTASSVAAAAVAADVAGLRELLASDPGAAQRPTGPYGWSPLMYLAYARLELNGDAVLAAARLLLHAGADPNDGRFFLGLPIPFTVITGVFGGGENNQPRHQQAIALARLLLSQGAQPNDRQTLYNRMFCDDDDFLELLFEFGLGQGTGGPWRSLLPDLLKAPAVALRDLLEWAVVHDQRARVALLAEHGVDVISPLDSGRTPLDLAVRNGRRGLAEQLRLLGAPAPDLDAVGAFIAAALAGDDVAVLATAPAVVEAARRVRPALVVWAAGQEQVTAVDLLIANGFDVNAFGRSDVPVEQKWHTALHAAVERNNPDLARRLLELGAATDLRDIRFGGTPLDWANHLQHTRMAELLSGW